MRRAPIFTRVVACALILTLPGCILGSPLAAFSGEPYGMVIDDVKAIDGKRGRIWSDAPFFAVLDIPIAFVLDTAFLPISLLTWGIKALVSDGDDSDSRRSRRAEEEDRRRRTSSYKPDRTSAKQRAADSN